MAEACGLTVSTIQNIWKAHGLAPYRWRKAAINRFVAQHNQSPNPFVWRADTDAIIAARARGFQAIRPMVIGFRSDEIRFLVRPEVAEPAVVDSVTRS